MKVKFTSWSGDCDLNSNPMVAIKTNSWSFEADGKPYSWSVRYEHYFDEDGDSKAEGYYIVDNNSGELKHDSRAIGWGDPECEEIERPNFNDEGWSVGMFGGLDFVHKVNEYFSNGSIGYGLLD